MVYLNKPSLLKSKGLAKQFRTKWTGPYRVLEKRGPVTYRIKELHGKTEHMVHAERLKPCKNSDYKIATNSKSREASDESDIYS